LPMSGGLDPPSDLANRRPNLDRLAFQHARIDALVVQSVVDAPRAQKSCPFDDRDDPLIVFAVGIADRISSSMIRCVSVGSRLWDAVWHPISCPRAVRVPKVVDVHVAGELLVVQTTTDDVVRARELRLIQDRKPLLIAAPPAIVKAQTHCAI